MSRGIRGPIHLGPPRDEGKRRYLVGAAVLAVGVLLFAASRHDMRTSKAGQRRGGRGFASLQQHIISRMNSRSPNLRAMLGVRKGEPVTIRVYVSVDRSGHVSVQNISARCGYAQCSNYGSIANTAQLDLRGFRLSPPEKPYTVAVTTSLSAQ